MSQILGRSRAAASTSAAQNRAEPRKPARHSKPLPEPGTSKEKADTGRTHLMSAPSIPTTALSADATGNADTAGATPSPKPFLERFIATCTPVGGIYRLDYDTAVVSTDDFRKKNAGGLARGAFLLAAATDRTGGDLRLAELEVILLRVRGIADLPNERSLMESRESVVADSFARGLDYGSTIDPMTQAMHQRGAIECDVLGTYYADTDGKTLFGADIDNVYSSAMYEVFVPSPKALSWIGSFPGPTGEKDDAVLPVGAVRYASTRRKAQEAELANSTVNVHVSDFVGRRTAVFGMTRTGKALEESTRLPVPVSERFPTGWALNAELIEGDEVYAADGSIARIIGFTDWRTEPVYAVHFADGQVVRVGADHNWFVSTDQTRANESQRRVKSARKADRVTALETLAAEMPGGSYATLKDLSRLSGLHVEYLRPLVKRAGLHSNTTWDRRTGGLLRVAIEREVTCYRTEEAWPILVEGAQWMGLAVRPDAQAPSDAWACTREMVTALLPADPDGKTVTRFEGRLRKRGIESKKAVRSLPAAYRGATLYPAGEVLLVAAHAASTKGGTPMPIEKVATTAEMASTLRAERRTNTEANGNWAVRIAAPLAGEIAALPVAPYVMGAWLGDGNSRNGQIAADPKPHAADGTADAHHMAEQIRAEGYDCHGIDSNEFVISAQGLMTDLRCAGVLKNKHIPAAYLRASFEQRLALVQGLMDTDGTIDKRGACELALSDERLATDALELIRSLGIRASRTIADAFYRNDDGELVECKRRHRIHFTTTQQVFRLPRKAARLKNVVNRSARWNFVTDIIVEGVGRTRCITVDHPSGLHLVEGFITTHNSNTIKTIVTAVYRYAAESGQQVGQVIFDPQGEYANVNRQDGTGLRWLGDAEHVRIYTSRPRKDKAHEMPLRLNFYDQTLFPVIWDMACDTMRDAETAYTKRFIAADMDEPEADNHSALTHWRRGRLAFYGLLSKAGYQGGFYEGNGGPATLAFDMKDGAAQKLAEEGGPKLKGGSGKYTVSSPLEAAQVTEWVGKLLGALEKARKGSKEDDAVEAKRLEDLVGKWGESEQFMAVNEVFHHVRGRGLAGLREMRDFHDPSGKGDLGEMVWEDMRHGRLVIVDLSIGSAAVTKVMSERLVTTLVNRASERFRDDLDPIPFNIVVEEAHNLFERGRDVKSDPWVRMSKEAAKYKIGLVYATQEVTGVDRRILSNTANWVIAHLNSTNETQELSRYYDFSTFDARLRKVEDVGFVVMKTYSSPYLVPVQIAKFDHAMINAARAAAGLLPVDAKGNEVANAADPHRLVPGADGDF